jgi:hypothetical protein
MTDELHRTGRPPEGAPDDVRIDPDWPEPAQRIIADKHARSARQPEAGPEPDTGSEGGAPEEDGPGTHASPDNMNVEHENQARWREIKM